MKFAKTFAVLAAATMAGTAIAELPDPNPRPNTDGTFTWFCGNNTQYPVIQDVLDACSDGDEVVVRGGQYVESLNIVRNDVTLRPFATSGVGAGNATWEAVAFWNPTEGFNNANGYAIRMTGGSNTYVGEPRSYTQLANGLEVATLTEVNNPSTYAIGTAQSPESITTNMNSTTAWSGFNSTPAEMALSFWSRSIDNVAVYSTDGTGTFQHCYMTTSNGFGGGIICSGDSNTTQFVSCTLDKMTATGNPLALADGTSGPAVNVITVTGGEPQFLGDTNTTKIGQSDGANTAGMVNVGGSDGIVSISGGKPRFDKCEFNDNFTPAGNGMINMTGADTRGDFTRCTMNGNTARYGTFYWDAAGAAGPDMCNFNRCNFVNNVTANTFGGGGSGQLHGGMMWVSNGVPGGAPLVTMSEVGGNNNNGGGQGYNTGLGAADCASDWFPLVRIGAPFTTGAPATITSTPAGLPGDMNGDGVLDGSDLNEIHTALGTCAYDGDLNGVINIEDLLGVIAAYGSVCQ